MVTGSARVTGMQVPRADARGPAGQRLEDRDAQQDLKLRPGHDALCLDAPEPAPAEQRPAPAGIAPAATNAPRAPNERHQAPEQRSPRRPDRPSAGLPARPKMRASTIVVGTVRCSSVRLATSKNALAGTAARRATRTPRVASDARATRRERHPEDHDAGGQAPGSVGGRPRAPRSHRRPATPADTHRGGEDPGPGLAQSEHIDRESARRTHRACRP